MDDSGEVKADVLVVGTGLVQSLVAAACSRVGKKVVHTDSLPFYGGAWASLTLDDFKDGDKCRGDDGGSATDSFNSHLNIQDVSLWDSGVEIYRRRTVLVDLCPKVCFAKGKMVQLLISSNTSRYLEFKEVSRLYQHNGTVTDVPCTKANLMTNRDISPMSKRKLVKFLQFCLEVAKGVEGKTVSESASFQELMSDTFRLAPELQEYILGSMTWLDGNAPASEGVAAMGRFLTSAGVFCPSPLIFPSYGGGEFPQAFCRLCAVFGGVYMLHMDPVSIRIDDSGPSAVVTGAQLGTEFNVTAPCVVVPERVAARIPKSSITPAPTRLYSRASFLLKCDRCAYIDESETAALISVPAGTCGLTAVCRALVLAAGSGTCPRGYMMCHLVSDHTPDSSWQEDMQRVFNLLFPDHVRASKDGSDPAASHTSEPKSVADTCRGVDNAADTTETATAATAAATGQETNTGRKVRGGETTIAGDSVGHEDGSDADASDTAEDTSTSAAESPTPSPPQLVWSVFFRGLTAGEQDGGQDRHRTNVDGLWICSDGGSSTPGYDDAVAEAERLFAAILPGEEFLPRAPDYDEIVHDDGANDEEQSDAENGDEETTSKQVDTGESTHHHHQQQQQAQTASRERETDSDNNGDGTSHPSGGDAGENDERRVTENPSPQ